MVGLVLPIDGLALVFGIYRFISIAVATCNVTGNCVAAVVVTKITGEFGPTAESVIKMEAA